MAVAHREVSQFLEDFKNAVLPSLRRGIAAFNNLASTLLSMDTDIITKEHQQFVLIRNTIIQVKDNLSQSDTAATTKLRHVDQLSETLTSRKGALDREQSSKKQCLSNLKMKLKSDIAILDMRKKTLQKARYHHWVAVSKLQDLQFQMEESQTVRDVGIGLAFIPIIGWIAGGIMIGVGQADLDQASWAVEQAQEEVDAFESQIQSLGCQISTAENQIDQMRREMNWVSADLERVIRDLKTVKHQHTAIANYQSQIRSAVNLLGQLAGTASVAEVQMRVLVLLGPVMTVLENVCRLAGQITQQSALSDRHLSALAITLQQNHNKLRDVEANKKIPAILYFA